MAVLIRKLKTLNTKKAFAVVTLAGLAAFAMSTPFAAAQGPQFNIFQICWTGGSNCDFPTLDAKDLTQGQGWSTSQADHDSRINANPGDVLEFSVYYHNGMPDVDENVAINAVVAAFASPNLGTAAFTHIISATVGAQNAGTVSSADAGRGGNITVRIQGSVPQALSLVPGSVQLFPNQGSSPRPGAQQMPDTIFNGGVNIGNVRGCFQYHGFVNFRLQVSQNQPQQGSLTVQKQVRNVSAGGAFNDTQVSANPGQTVEFRIVVSAVGNAVSNVFLKDAMDSRLSFVGQLFVDGSAVDSTGFFTGGISLGTINPGVSREIKYQATVAAAGQFTVGTTVLPNLATAFNTQTSAQDGANVVVVIQAQNVACVYTWDPPLVSDGSQRGLRHVGDPANLRVAVTGLQPFQSFNQVNQHISGAPTVRAQHAADGQGSFLVDKDQTIVGSVYVPGDYNSFIEVNGAFVATCTGFRIESQAVQQLGLTKLVQNNNTNSSFVKQVDAQPSDRLTFQLQISPQSSNQALQNATLRDLLPAKLTYVSNSLNVNGAGAQDAISFFNNGLSLGTIQPNQQITVTFQADVAGVSNFTAGQCEILTNNATANASSNLTASDAALVRVCKSNPVKQPGSPGQRPD